MTDAVTYSLTSGLPNSEHYYRRVREYADEVLELAEVSLTPIVAQFMDYVREYRLEDLRRKEEYILELLSFCTLWNSYGSYALAVNRAPFVTMARMAEWRKRHRRMKPAIDLARGLFTTLFLLPGRAEGKPPSLPTLRDVDRLCLWLEATGEFREQALRFVRWRAFWETIPPTIRMEMRSRMFSFADWFTLRSEEALGGFTANVEQFLNRSRTRYRWREDRIQCSRSRVEYHLNMVGAEIMNRAFRPDFRNTDVKAVLVPGCMRGRSEEECESTRVPEGLRCEGCLPGCNVNRLREMGKKHHVEVFIFPHASDLSFWSPRPGQSRRGVVAAACVTTLVEGGWELKRYDVPAQCVLLDYSGCKKHWRPDGVATAFNVRELRRILDGQVAAS